MASLECEYLTLEQDAGISTVLLNRLETHNAFNAQMIAEITQMFEYLAMDMKTRVIVLRSAGKHFCAGADLAWMKQSKDFSAAENIADAENLSAMCAAIANNAKPTIAVVDGACYGGAVGLVACCDIALATNKARFCLSEVKLGLIPAVISPYVVRAIGARQASRYMLTAEVIDSLQAKQINLVHEQASKEEIDQQLSSLTTALINNGPQALSLCKQLIKQVEQSQDEQRLNSELARSIASIRVGVEAQEGLSAFFEKRSAKW